tara:strand:- start:1105 stop:1302 length:198 start_codon:yes stop_codon:yes gene_type:complete
MSERPIIETKGPGILSLLLTLFIALKLTGMITWSWWWVLSPMWIGALVVVSVITVVGTILYIKEK